MHQQSAAQHHQRHISVTPGGADTVGCSRPIHKPADALAADLDVDMLGPEQNGDDQDEEMWGDDDSGEALQVQAPAPQATREPQPQAWNPAAAAQRTPAGWQPDHPAAASASAAHALQPTCGGSSSQAVTHSMFRTPQTLGSLLGAASGEGGSQVASNLRSGDSKVAAPGSARGAGFQHHPSSAFPPAASAAKPRSRLKLSVSNTSQDVTQASTQPAGIGWTAERPDDKVGPSHTNASSVLGGSFLSQGTV